MWGAVMCEAMVMWVQRLMWEWSGDVWVQW